MDITVPVLADLKDVFETIKTAEYAGIKGVLRFDSGVEGPTVGITVCTHGNEPVGLAALWHFLNNGALEDLRCGQVFFVLNNLKATENYFAATTDEEKYRSRFVDMNMNRMPESLEASLSDKYEIVRAQELLPVWSLFDIGMDLHSTSVASDPMMVLRHGSNFDMVRGFPVPNIISGLSNVMRDNPVMDFYGGVKQQRAQVVLLEAGCHETPEAFAVGIACVEALLGNLGLTDYDADGTLDSYDHYQICDSIFFPNESYSTTEIYPCFAPISGGDCLATGNGEDIIAEEDGHALMCFAQGKPPTLEEEALFISLPVERMVLESDEQRNAS